jgi:hypothetical protein
MKLRKCTDVSGPCFARLNGGCRILTECPGNSLCAFRKPDRQVTHGRRYKDRPCVHLDKHGLPIVDSLYGV